MSDVRGVIVFRVAVLFALASFASAGCKPSQGSGEVDKGGAPPAPFVPRGVHWKRGMNPSNPGTSPPDLLSAPPTPHLVYYGGRVVSNVQVVQVLYGAGSYDPHVTSTASPSVATFYQGVLNSPYVDWLTEYDTNLSPPPQSNQIIGRGSFASQVTITPSAANSGATIDDTNIQAELAAQIQAGVLPPPSLDAAGNNNTYYAVYFPHGKVVTLGSSSSCVRFCAYHGTIANIQGVGEIYYGVHPDFQAGSGCESGCGAATTAFGNITQVASHELIETVTDPEVGIVTQFAPPLAWYDTYWGEIGDICNDENGRIVGGDGVSYDVQTEFSNIAGQCIVTRPPAPTISATPPAFEGGTDVTGTVFLDAIAPAGGVTVALASGTPALVSVPPSVLVPAGSATGTFPITSVQSQVKATVTLTATFPSTTASVDVTVVASPTVSSVALSPASVTGGSPATATVTLRGPAPVGGALVTLASSDPAAASVPATIPIPEGTTTATFTIPTVQRAVTETVTISASYNDLTQTAALTVVGIPAVLQVILTPSALEGGSTGDAGGVVALSALAPPGGALIFMTSTDPTIVLMSPVLPLAPNADGGGFVLTTTPVTAPTLVTITATYPAGVTASAPLLVMPPGNAAFDAGFGVPRCTAPGRFCDTGGTLVLGRGNVAGGAEPNAPNTLGGSCLDGAAGTFHTNESLDRLSITTLSGNPLAAGELVRVDASVWNFDTLDFLDVFFAPDATNPVWTSIATIPGGTVYQRAEVLSAQFTLPGGALPVIRGAFRRSGSAVPCTTGAVDDRDDLVFALASGAPANQRPTVNAGPDQTINLPAVANLAGTAGDDGLPTPPGKLAIIWTEISGPGTVWMPTAGTLATTAQFSDPGTYTLRLTVSDGALTVSDDVVVNVNPFVPVNQPPVVDAGPDQSITLPGAASLAGTVSDDGLPNPPGAVTTAWSMVSGPGTVTFANAANRSTTATFSAAGTYDLRLSASDGALAGSDDVVITVAAPPNTAPVVNAGPDQTITLPAAASLAGTVSDDGLPNPPGAVTVTWSKVSGPGTVTFANSHAKATTASFSLSGSYVLRLTASDGALSSNDTVAITVNAAPTNKAPVVNAGPDQTVTLPSTAALNGTVTDDGLPNPPGAVTVTWSKVSGPGTVTFGNSHAKATTASFSTSGTYVVRLTASDGALSASDTAQITARLGACASLCSNPVVFTINGSFQSGSLGTGAVCYQTTSAMHGGNCGNVVSPRTLKVNGTTEVCNSKNWASLPAARNAGYCVQTTSGNLSSAFFTAF